MMDNFKEDIVGRHSERIAQYFVCTVLDMYRGIWFVCDVDASSADDAV